MFKKKNNIDYDIIKATGKFISVNKYQNIIDKINAGADALNLLSNNKLYSILFMLEFEKHFKSDIVFSKVKLFLCEGWATINNNKMYYHTWIKLDTFNDNGEFLATYYLDPKIEIILNRSINKINSEQYCVKHMLPLEEVKDNVLLGKIW